MVAQKTINENKEKNLREIEQKVCDRVHKEAATYTVTNDKTGDKITSEFVDLCLEANEYGDGMLYATTHRGRYLYNISTGEWLRWNGHHWELDAMGQHLAAAEDIVDVLLKRAEKIAQLEIQAVKNQDEHAKDSLEKKRKDISGRIRRLRSDRGRNSCLKFAWTCKDPLAIRGDELDLHPWLLACKNGVIDLKTGEMRKGRQDDLLLKASPVEWKGLDEKAPTWDSFLMEALNGDEELNRFLARSFGYGITGLNHEHNILVLWGYGRNGKGTFIETISHVMGELAGPIQAEMLLDQGKMKNSAGPSPDIMALRGLRLAFASETDEGRRFSPARVKWLTGGDTLVGRYPYDKREVHFRPTHTLVLLTNNKPQAPASDFAFWERLLLVPFSLSFVTREPIATNERPAIKGLSDELKNEASGILAWLVRGCLDYQKEGRLNPPESVTKATAEYRREENILADFIDDYCKIDEFAKSGSSALYDNFSKWFQKNVSKKGITQARFGRLMGQRFEKTKENGIIYYTGIEMVKEVENDD